VTSVTVPDPDPRIAWALWYLSLGWALLIVRRDTKQPYSNCANCPLSGTPGAHDGWACPHLYCHGVQAATRDVAVILALLQANPGAHLAVACGRVSMIIVLDFESHDLGEHAVAPHCRTGVDFADRWEWLHGWSLPVGPVARSISGGVHQFHALGDDDLIPSRNLIQLAFDCQSDGRYAVLPDGTSGREWLSWPDMPSIPLVTAAMTDYLETVPRRVFRTTSGAKRLVTTQGEPLPETDEFRTDGLGIGSGARHSDAYQLGWRFAGRGMSEHDALTTLTEIWEVSVQDGETLDKIWGHCQAGMADQARKNGSISVSDSELLEIARRLA
jgi:hypothetical protein